MKKIKIVLATFSMLFVLNNTLAMEKNPNKQSTEKTKDTTKKETLSENFVFEFPNKKNETLNKNLENFFNTVEGGTPEEAEVIMSGSLNLDDLKNINDFSEKNEKVFGIFEKIKEQCSPEIIEKNKQLIEDVEQFLKPFQNIKANDLNYEGLKNYFLKENMSTNISTLEECVNNVQKEYLTKYSVEKEKFYEAYAQNLNKAIKIIKNENENILEENIFENEILLKKLNYDNSITDLKNIINFIKSYNKIKNLIEKNSTSTINSAKRLIKQKLFNENTFKQNYDKLKQEENKKNLISLFEELEKYYDDYAEVLKIFEKINKDNSEKKENFLMNFYKETLKDTGILNNLAYDCFEKIYENFNFNYSNFSDTVKNYFKNSTIENLSEKDAFNNTLETDFENNTLKDLIAFENNEEKIEIYLALATLVKKMANNRSTKYYELNKNLKDDIKKEDLRKLFLDLKKLWETNEEFISLKKDFEDNFKQYADMFKSGIDKTEQKLIFPKEFDFTNYEQSALNAVKLLEYKPLLSIELFKKFQKEKIWDKDYFKKFYKDVTKFHVLLNMTIKNAVIATNSFTRFLCDKLTTPSSKINDKEKIFEKFFNLEKHKENKNENNFELNYNNYLNKLKNLKDSVIFCAENFISQKNIMNNFKKFYDKKQIDENDLEYEKNRIIAKEKIKTTLNFLKIVDNILAIEQIKNMILKYTPEFSISNKFRKYLFEDKSEMEENSKKIEILAKKLKEMELSMNNFLNVLK